MWPVSRLRRRIDVFAAVLACLLAGLPAAAAPYDPQLRFQQLRTPHFVIYFHQGETDLAARLARIAESAWTDMGGRFGWRLPDRTHVVLADHTDVANGWATPLPFNTIMVTAAWPAGSDAIGLTDDWLRLVFTHEFTHIVHLDQSRGWAGVTRRVLGRVPVAFPNLSLPGWQIEGLATYYESAVTGRGRLFATDFRAIEREPARNGVAMPLDRANGGLVRWPAGTATYASGLGFHRYLAERFGPDRFTELASRTAGRLPYFGSTAFARVYGTSLGELWRGYQQSLASDVAGGAPRVSATRLTREAFEITGPRFLPRRCDDCPEEIAYSVHTPHAFPSLKVVETDGGRVSVLTTRYLGSTVGSTRDTVVFDQRELARNAGLYSDLYALDRGSGSVRRLTTEARLLDPDLSRDGRTLVAVRQSLGQRDLVTLPFNGTLGDIRVLRSESGAQFATPRWSPDGRSIAVERHRLGDTSEVVIVDSVTGDVRVIGRGATRAVTPAWRPDGRAIVAAVDSQDGPFNLVEFSLDTDAVRRRQLTDTTGGAMWPDVSHDGRTLAYAGLSAAGFDVFTQPYPVDDGLDQPAPQAAPPAASPAVDATAASAARDDSAGVIGPTARYAPWATLLPRAWMPLLTTDSDQTRAGLSIGGRDVLGYHAFGASASWRLSGPAAATDRASQPDWGVVYVYDRWRPQFFASASRTTSYFQGASAERDGVATWREQTTEAGMSLPLRRVLRSQRLIITGQRSRNTVTGPAPDATFNRLALRSGWAFRTARQYGYSISPEHGVHAGATVEIAGAGLASLTDATTVTADVRGYLPGVARHHVVALRVAAGVSNGPRALGRVFRLGGGMPNAEPLHFGRGAFSLLRGFPLDRFAGRRVAVANADYRLPLAWVERGRGTWPFFLRAVHGAVFADAGHAWNTSGRIADVKVAAGGEIAADVVLGYTWPLTIAAGLARGRDFAGGAPDTTTAYVRIGRAF